MGVLDKLLFWRKEEADLDFEVSGCFTLPIDGGPESGTDAATQPAVEPMAEAVEVATEQTDPNRSGPR